MIEAAAEPAARTQPNLPPPDEHTITDALRINIAPRAESVEPPRSVVAEQRNNGYASNGHSNGSYSSNGHSNGTNGTPNGTSYTNGNGHMNEHNNGNGAHHDAPANGNGASANEAPAAPVTVIKARTRVSLNNTSGSESGTPSAAPVTLGRTLHLVLPRGDNLDVDVRCMQEVDQLLRSSEGSDIVTLHIPDGESVVLLRPHHKINCTPDLLGALRGLLGDECAVVE
jgi:hypothetical protein